MMVREFLAIPFFISAIVFGLAGCIGLFRFPDPYSRLQAGSVCGTTAVISIFGMVLLLSPNITVSTRVVIIVIFFLVSAPTASHIVARFTWNAGILPWKPDISPHAKRHNGRRK